MSEHIVVIAGSSALPVRVLAEIPDDAIVLAVDGGLDHALAAGLQPSGVIGDLDSVTVAGMEWAEANATISRHPADKDNTDTELALAFAAEMDPSRLTLIGGGDRLDHTIAAVGALGAACLTSIPALDGWWNGQRFTVLHGPGRCEIVAEIGTTLSLLALHGPATKVSIDGVRWPLDGCTLGPAVGLGISNEVTDPTVRVRLSTGVLTIFEWPPERTASRPTTPRQSRTPGKVAE